MCAPGLTDTWLSLKEVSHPLHNSALISFSLAWQEVALSSHKKWATRGVKAQRESGGSHLQVSEGKLSVRRESPRGEEGETH